MTSIQINNGTGVITVLFNAANVGVAAGANTLTMTPWMRNTAAGSAYAVALAAGNTGAVDWGCASATNAKATNDGIATAIPGAALLAKYAPAQCR